MLLIVLGFWMLWRFRFVALAVIAAAFLHIGMKPAVEWMHGRGMRRAWGVALVYTLLLAVVVAFLVMLAPLITAQVGNFVAELPNYYRLIRNGMLASEIDLLMRLGRLLPPAGDTAALRALLMQAVAGDLSVQSSPWQIVGSVGKSIFFAVAVLAMAFYLTMDRDRLLQQLLLRLPKRRRESARDLIGEIETKVGAFIRGQLILCSVIGTLSLIAYFAIGLPNALALAAVAFVFEAIPIVGPALTAIVSALVATSLGPDKVAWTLGAGVLIQASENNIIVPRIMDKAVGVNPIVTLLAITTFTLLFGIVGALLAIPLAAVIQIFVDRYLFQVDDSADAALELAEAELGAGADASTNGRSHVDLLRAEAAELAQDVRKQLRSDEIEIPPEVAAIEDMIEQTALEISTLLARSAQPDVTVAPLPVAQAIAAGRQEARR